MKICDSCWYLKAFLVFTRYLLWLGLDGAGKTSILSVLLNEDLVECPEPTSGFSIKAANLPKAVINIKELGGKEHVCLVLLCSYKYLSVHGQIVLQ